MSKYKFELGENVIAFSKDENVFSQGAVVLDRATLGDDNIYQVVKTDGTRFNIHERLLYKHEHEEDFEIYE